MGHRGRGLGREGDWSPRRAAGSHERRGRQSVGTRIGGDRSELKGGHGIAQEGAGTLD